jgi:hypothetical protein
MKSTSMIIRFSLVSAVLGTPFCLWAQNGPLPSQSQPWTLPANSAVVNSGPRTYHFSIDYNTAGSAGEIVQRQRVTGDCTRGLPNNEVEWHNVGVATVLGPDASFPAPEKSAFMEGFRYHNDLAATMDPAFFKSFSPTAVVERNLVWDTGMFESFGQSYLDKFKLNVPLHAAGKDQDVNMPQVGTFRNHDIVLEWVGRSRRNGQDCVLIEYRAFFNPVNIDGGGIALKARSDYWGEIWVSAASKQIEYATLYEEVTGQIKLPGRDVAQPLNVFRVGSFEPVPAGEAGR